MRLSLYSVYDRLLGVYLAPFPARGDVEARRQLANTLNDPAAKSIPLVQDPGAYDLMYMATFDDESGEVFAEARAGQAKAPSLVCNCKTLMPTKPEPVQQLGDQHGRPAVL